MAFAETKQTNKQKYIEFRRKPKGVKYRPRRKNLASQIKKVLVICVHRSKQKGIMFRMVPDQFFSTLIIVRKNLKNPPGRLIQRKTLVIRIWSEDCLPPPDK